MKKKFVSGILTAIGIAAIVLFTVSCATIGLTTVAEERPEGIYVGNVITGYAVATWLIEQRGWSSIISGFGGNGIYLERIGTSGTSARLLTRSDITFSVSPAGMLNVSLTNNQRVVTRPDGAGRQLQVWEPIPSQGVDMASRIEINIVRIFRNEIILGLEEIVAGIPAEALADHSPEGSAVVNNFLGNLQYNAAFMSTLTQVGRATFVELITGRTYEWNWPLASIAENRNPAIDRRFVARFQTRRIGGGARDLVTLNVYTNNTALLAVPLNQNVPFSGVLISVHGNNTFNLLHE